MQAITRKHINPLKTTKNEQVLFICTWNVVKSGTIIWTLAHSIPVCFSK
jgi:hypothetical protein